MVATARTSSRSANRSIARTSSWLSTLHAMLDRDEAPIAPERLPERLGGTAGGIDLAGNGQPSRRRTRPEQRHQPGRMRADLRRGHGRVAALAEHVRVGDQPAEVRVPHRVLREQHDVGVRAVGDVAARRLTMRRGAARAAEPQSDVPDRRPHPRLPSNGQRGAEDGLHTLLLAGFDEPRGAVEAVAIADRDGRHAELDGAAHELFGRERAFLQREAGPDVEMHERRVRRAGVAQ